MTEERTKPHLISHSLLQRELAIGIEGFPAQIYFSTSDLGNVSRRWEQKEGQGLANLQILYQVVAFTPSKRVHMSLQHEDKIGMVGTESPDIVEGGALITSDRGVALSLFPADCFPVIIADTSRSVLALLHAGWKGTDLQLAKKVVVQITSKIRTEPQSLMAVIGPGIRSCCYYSKGRISYLRQKSRWEPYLPDFSRIDLAGYIHDQLVEGGILTENIFDVALCTRCAQNEQGNPLFFSNIRAGDTGEVEGRFATVTSL